MIIDKKIEITTGMQIVDKFSNRNTQREIRNQQLSTLNKKNYNFVAKFESESVAINTIILFFNDKN